MTKKLLIFTLAAMLLSKLSMAQTDFYDINTIQTIKIYFGFSDWDYRLDTSKNGAEGYILADSVVVNGVNFQNCGVKYKGNSSYSANRPKNPFHIKLDWTINQSYQNYEDIKLGNGFSDPSMIREASSYAIIRQYMDAPKSNYAKVYVNGNYYGLMSNSEDIGNKFNIEHFYSSKFVHVKCNPANAGPGGGASSLLYNGTDSASYYSSYEVKSDYGWKHLINFCDTLNNVSSALNDILDIDRVLWMHALNNVLVNLDSYAGSFKQNYYMYRNHANQWIPTIWDVNMSYGSFTNTGSGGPGGGSTAMINLSPTLHQTDAAWPLISKVLANTSYMKMYVAHMKTINNENFLNAQYKPLIESMRTLIDNAVQTDANFLYTYTNYQNALTTTITGGGPGGGTIGVYQLMDARTTFLNTHALFTQTAPTITAVTPSSATPAFGSSVTVTANVTNTTASEVYLGYRYKKSDRFVRVKMYDDGAHGDGGGGDNVYGATISANSLQIQYYIYAENANAGKFSPERAEFEFYTLSPTLATAQKGDIVINEFMASNNSGIENEAGKKKDWIELYNKTSTPLSLGGLYLSDSANVPQKWAFPSTAFIPANGYMLVWADDRNADLLELHTNFNLSNTGEHLSLAQNAANYLDSTTFGAQVADVAMARCPNGSGNLQSTTTSTPRASNSCTVNLEDNAATTAEIALFPNPANSQLNFLIPENTMLKSMKIINSIGQVVKTLNLPTTSMVDISDLAAGLYVADFVLNTSQNTKIKFLKL